MKSTLLYIVILYQIISLSSAGIRLPYLNSAELSLPVKQKSSPTSTPITRSSPWLGDELSSELYSSTLKGTAREFSSLLLVSSSTKPVKIPKIDKLSMKDVKLPDGVTLEGILSKIKSLSKYDKINKEEVKIPSSYSKDFVTKKPNKPLPVAPKLYKSIPDFIKQNNRSPDAQLLSSSYKDYVSPVNNLLSSNIECPVLNYPDQLSHILTSIKTSNPLPKPNSGLYTPLSVGSERSSVSPAVSLLSTYNAPLANNKFSSTNSWNSISSLPYPLYYKSMNLPKVRTPTLIEPFFKTPSPSRPSLHPVLPELVSPYFNSAKAVEVPKTPSDKLFSTKPLFTGINSLPSVSNTYLKDLPFSGWTDRSFSFPKLSSSSPNSFYTSCNQYTSATMPSIPPTLPNEKLNPYSLQSTYFGFNDLPKYTNYPNINVNNLENLIIPDLIPVIDAYVECVENINTVDIINNFQPFYNADNVPSLQRLNIAGTSSAPFIPDAYSFNLPWYPGDSVYNAAPTSVLPISIQIASEASSSIYTPAPIILQSSVTPVSQVNSPSISEISTNLVSSINNILSDITQNIVSNYKSYLSSSPIDFSKNSKSLSKNTLPMQAQLPPVNIFNTKPSIPVSYSSPFSSSSPVFNSPIVIPFDSSSYDFQPLASSLQPIITTLSSQSSPVSSYRPQFSPSYLPIPSIPCYTSISSPLNMKPSQFKVEYSGDEEELNRMLELMLIAELLNEDENFDWEDLDTLLALLNFS